VIQKLAQRIADYLNQELNLGDSRQSIIAYGLEILLGGLVKVVSFIAIPALLGILPQTWAAMSAATFFRFPAGGAHLTAYYRCLIGYLLTFCFIGALAKITASYIPVNLLFLITLGFWRAGFLPVRLVPV
jgi:accessory gene regulator B